MDLVRMNVVFPGDLAFKLKKVVPRRGISKFLSEVAKEKIREIEKKEAIKEILALPPTFTKIKDSASYIRKERRLDEKRLRRLAL